MVHLWATYGRPLGDLWATFGKMRIKKGQKVAELQDGQRPMFSSEYLVVSSEYETIEPHRSQNVAQKAFEASSIRSSYLALLERLLLCLLRRLARRTDSSNIHRTFIGAALSLHEQPSEYFP